MPLDPEHRRTLESLGGVFHPLGAHWELHFQHRGRALDDKGLATVAQLKDDIHVLNLRDTKITDAGLAEVGKLGQLRRLHLERTAIGDAGLGHLANLQQLEYLNLYGTKVTDAGLAKLEPLVRLQKLFVWQTAVTPTGCTRLETSNPRLEIVRGVNLEAVAAAAVAQKKAEAEVVRIELTWVPAGAAEVPRSKTGEFTNVLIQNSREKAVKLYWSEYGGGLKFYHEIPAGERLLRNTYSDAIWVVHDLEENLLGHFHVPIKPSAITIPK